MRQNNSKKTFGIHCTIDNGEMLTINIPTRIYNDFERCGNCQQGTALLCTIFEEFGHMSIDMRYDLQQFIYHAHDDIMNMQDILYIIRAIKLSKGR